MKLESIVSLALSCVAIIGCGDHRDSSSATIANVHAATTYTCTPCSGRGAPPFFDGGWSYSVVGSDGRSSSYDFQSSRECNAHRDSYYVCTGRPPMSTDH
jgi:hypothetical protein